MDKNNYNFPKEMFEFANKGEKLHDQKFEDKPIGYFKDAWIRFRKNKASIVAAIIIIGIVLFSLLMPLFNTRYDSSFLDVHYAKKGPYSDWWCENTGMLNGGTKRNVSERGLSWLAATGMGAEHTYKNLASGKKITVADSLESKYSAIIKYKDGGVGPDGKDVFKANVNAYMEVGFVYLQIEQSEYQKIVDWEKENGIQVLYPIIANNEYTYHPIDVTNANYWYKTNAKGDPIKVNSEGKAVKISFKETASFEDNYKRDKDGNLVYTEYIGGGDLDTAQLRIRVLYYNYYIYENGFAPKYIFGTDSQGYDLALRMADGIKLSLLVSLTVSFINFFIGAIYGAIAGYYGGIVDLTMERITDILSGIPSIVVMTLFQMHLAQKVGVIPSLLFAFVLTGWIGMSSRVRTQFYRFKNQEYVMAARTLGARDRRIIWKHIFPNTLGTIITGSVLAIPGVIFTESMLSFLGIVNLGGAETTSLGTLLSDASNIWTNYPHLMLFPAMIISLLMICFNLFGNGLRDAFNPSLRGVEE